MNIDSLLEELNLPKDCIKEDQIPEQKPESGDFKTPYEETEEIFNELLRKSEEEKKIRDAQINAEADEMYAKLMAEHGVDKQSVNTQISENTQTSTQVETSESQVRVETSESQTSEELIDTPDDIKECFLDEPPAKISIAEYNKFKKLLEEERAEEEESKKYLAELEAQIESGEETEEDKKLNQWRAERDIYIANKHLRGEDLARALGQSSIEYCDEYLRELKRRGQELKADTSMIYIKPRPADPNNLPDVDFDYDPTEIIDPNKQLPYEFETKEQNSRFMWDNYLFRIPFTKNMPKNVYNKIMTLEVLRKVVDKKNQKLSHRDFMKTYNKLVDDVCDIIETQDFNLVAERIKRWHYPLKENLKFEDLKIEGMKYITIPSGDYEIFKISDAFDGNLPEDVKPRDKKEYEELRELVLNYAQKKAEGYMSQDGKLKLRDLRPITEEDDHYIVRERQWNIELNIEKWEYRCRVIKGEMISLGEALEKGYPHPLEGIDEKMDQDILDKQEIREHPTDSTKIIVNDKVCDKVMNSYTGDKLKNPIVDEQANTEYLEDQFIDAYLTYEEAIKAAKEEFKLQKNWLRDQGVAVKSVERAVRALRRELKRKPEEKKKEDEVYDRISRRLDMVGRISGLEAMAV